MRICYKGMNNDYCEHQEISVISYREEEERFFNIVRDILEFYDNYELDVVSKGTAIVAVDNYADYKRLYDKYQSAKKIARKELSTLEPEDVGFIVTDRLNVYRKDW